MKIVATYSFNGGKETVDSKYIKEFIEIEAVINSIDTNLYKTKTSREKTMIGKMLFSPLKINKAFQAEFSNFGWSKHKVKCDYKYGDYLQDYIPAIKSHVKPYREMDFVKPGSKLGIEVQFGKYAFMVYNVCAKMTIFNKMGVIDTGIEIVPVKRFADEMSTGVSYFEQFAWDLHHRGESNIDIPVLILGVDA